MDIRQYNIRPGRVRTELLDRRSSDLEEYEGEDEGEKMSTNSFDPIYDENCEILILGTVPGRESLDSYEYYRDSRNRMWEVIEEVFGGEVTSLNYDKKKEYLLDKHIALWDVCESCDRVGSRDDTISNVRFNDIKGLIKKTKIRAIICNGGTPSGPHKDGALYYLLEYIKTLPGERLPEVMVIVGAPSTSSQNGHYAGEKLIDAWKDAVKACRDTIDTFDNTTAKRVLIKPIILQCKG